MGERTDIQWADSTWNPWMGCTKVSPGCKHCYMYRDMERYGRDPFTVVRTKPPTFGAPLKWRQPKRIFTCSWSDWFHPTADPWRAEAWAVVRCTPWHTYMILTKRSERIAPCLPSDWGPGYANVWLGVSAETQAFVEERVPNLLHVAHGGVRFVSAEPLLGPVDLQRYLSGLQWVIAGGESGPHFRPMQLQWARDLRDQCDNAGVPFFFKQHAGRRPHALGRELDGREWNDRP